MKRKSQIVRKLHDIHQKKTQSNCLKGSRLRYHSRNSTNDNNNNKKNGMICGTKKFLYNELILHSLSPYSYAIFFKKRSHTIGYVKSQNE